MDISALREKMRSLNSSGGQLQATGSKQALIPWNIIKVLALRLLTNPLQDESRKIRNLETTNASLRIEIEALTEELHTKMSNSSQVTVQVCRSCQLFVYNPSQDASKITKLEELNSMLSTEVETLNERLREQSAILRERNRVRTAICNPSHLIGRCKTTKRTSLKRPINGRIGRVEDTFRRQGRAKCQGERNGTILRTLALVNVNRG